jgi:peptide/nickel transport system substrate-binding protein
MEEAQALVRRSGAAGTHVTVWYSAGFEESDGVDAKGEAEYVAGLLEELGFVTELQSTGTLDDHFAALQDPDRSREIQIALGGWLADYPAASNFFTILLSCDAPVNYGAFCDPEIDAMIERAVRIQSKDPAASSEEWTQVDRAVTDLAPWVSLVNTIDVEIVSERLGNYQYNAQWGLLLAQVWVR